MTKEYVAAVVKVWEECEAAHAVEKVARKEAIKTNGLEDPVVRLLHVTCKATRAQCNQAIDVFLDSINNTLKKHMPVHAQGPLISNALSTAFQFQMSIWHMIGKECICPLWVKHSDWCGLAGIVQAIVKTFPKNFAPMFPPPAPPVAAVPMFSSSLKPALSDEEDEDDHSYDAGSNFRRFETSSPALSSGVRRGLGEKCRSFTHSSMPLPRGGAFTLMTDSKEVPSSSLGAAPAEDDDPGLHSGNDEFHVADDAED